MIVIFERWYRTGFIVAVPINGGLFRSNSTALTAKTAEIICTKSLPYPQQFVRLAK
jgi:hypothetical protein